MGRGRGVMSTTAQRDSAPAKASGLAMFLALGPWVDAFPVPSRPGPTVPRAALPAPPAPPATPVNPGLQQAGGAFAARLNRTSILSRKRPRPRVGVRSRATREAGSAGWAQGDLARIHLSFNELDA